MKNVLKNPILYIVLAGVLVLAGCAVSFVRRAGGEEYYIVGNQKYEGTFMNFSQDVHKVSFADGQTSYTNYPMGYNVAFLGQAEFDVSHAKILTKGTIPEKDIAFSVTKEFSPYEDVIGYVADFENRYLMDPKYIAENNLTIHRDEMYQVGDYQVESIIFTRNAPESGIYTYNTYAHCYLYTPTQTFFRMTFNTKEYSQDFVNVVDSAVASFHENVPQRGTAGFYETFRPVIPEYWSEETKTVYNNIVNGDQLLWGVYRPQAVRNRNLKKVEALEEVIAHKFSAVMDYIYFGDDVPVEGLRDAYNQGKIVEFTIQLATVMNTDLNGYTPFFEVLDGQRDGDIRKMAAQFKEFGHPVLLRLNNEMNSDWVSYGGACTLNEPELYKQVWRHIYDIFKEEGVNNTIWIFNPNDRNFPPNEYNHFVNYYPGDEYVQIFGVTGYNTGTYYKEIGEEWREFEFIYDGIQANCGEYFGEFPWMITEFSSSSIGGDKPQWIRNMFDVIHKYENIKIAVWFDCVDYDFSYPESENVVARPYLLNETPECAEAFREGLIKTGYTPKNIFE